MTQDEIITAVRYAIKEPSPILISDTAITAVTLRGVKVLWEKINEVDPTFCHKRISLSSNTNVFAWPSDCLNIRKVWDMKTNAQTITGATKASPIVITCEDHGFSDDDIILVHSVLGNLAANGTWKVDEAGDDTLELYGSTGDDDYTSGGKMFKEETTFTPIKKIDLSRRTGHNSNLWYPRGKYIVVDKIDFSYDIIVDYVGDADALTDIPAEYHEGLVSFCVIHLLQMAQPGSKRAADTRRIIDFHTGMWNFINDQIKQSLRVSSEPTDILDNMGYDYMME